MAACTLPRLSGAVRAFSGTTEDCNGDLTPNQDDVKAKRTARNRKLNSGVSWSMLKKVIEQKAVVDKEMSSKALHDLKSCAREIAGPEAPFDFVEASAVQLVEMFRASEGSVTNEHTQQLRRLHGPFPATAASNAAKVVSSIATWLPDRVMNQLFEERQQSGESKQSKDKAFGVNVKFHHNGLDMDSDSENWLDVEEEDHRNVSLNMQYNGATLSECNGTNGKTDSKRIDGVWLRNQLEQPHSRNSAITLNELCTTVFDSLASSKSSEELQTELFDLLGFDSFELIGTILENRRNVIENSLSSASDLATVHKAYEKEEVRPKYGCQVTVQSEQEKQLRKAMRKQEKKAMSRFATEEEEGTEEVYKSFGLDPDRLRAQREADLLAAANAPLFSQGSSSRMTEVPRYPFVWDSHADARQSSAFIGGSKMVLPMDFERDNNKMFEEIHIPAASSAPANVGHKLIPIASLDEIGQRGFEGMKTLNRIQSVVFEAAYQSNENLLICAPTGAGKTNIAMLTVLHEIKQHIQQGVIKKDEFKIVYVAPMKALAAEMVRNFGKRLAPLGIIVKELTGDMSLTKKEIQNTQMLVTTPEKWDVVTRKSTGDVALAQIVRLLIIDEVHLLHDDRGAVIETLVARTLRQVESQQSMIRIVGLSATLPNYLDVAHFLHVNPYKGLFFFDGRFRPVPLAQSFCGVKATNRIGQMEDMNKICYEKVVEQVRRGYQVMVFVHARNETVRTAKKLQEMAQGEGASLLFQAENNPRLGDAMKVMGKSRNKQLRELFADGFAIHHAGMLRQDRNYVEKYFADGLIKCLVCTATLAWGVNLPAHAVIIKGTQIYDAKNGAFVDLGILDVMQIFGRAGRPQYDKFGHGTIITAHDKLHHYLSLLTRANPIESQFTKSLTDNLNAEISLGTVTNLDEAVQWLSYTYLFIRMLANPLVYGLKHDTRQDDPHLEEERRKLITSSGRELDKAKMIRFDERTGYMHATDLGRVASNYYIKYATIVTINEMLSSMMDEGKCFELLSKSQEFEQVKVREEELQELDFHLNENCCCVVAGGSENPYGKVNILLQTYITRSNMDNFSLVSDQAYVAQNAARIIRALFEVALHQSWPIAAGRLLTLCKVIDKRMWGFEHPLKQFDLPYDIQKKLSEKKLPMSKLREMDATEIGHMIHHVRMGSQVKKAVHQLPHLELEAEIAPITRTILRVKLNITPLFNWHDKVHGSSAEPFWIWVEDAINNRMYHREYYMMHKKHVVQNEAQVLTFTIPIFEPMPSQFLVRAVSDRWLGAEVVTAMSFQHLILPERLPPHTELLDLHPLPLTALKDPKLEALYPKFTHFNPVQTQIFHTLYHTDTNVLLGAPTGSGKTIAAELAIFRLFREYPGSKAVYIAPLKALVRERMEDWKVRIEQKLGKRVVELTGDVTPDMRAVARADLIVTTPEKWDGISRSWQTRGYVKAVNLIVIDEIHLLGENRGPVLEVIVSRTNFISSHTSMKVRVVGLSTALANARDLADWLGIKQAGLFNFRPSVRPVPLEVHIDGFPGKHYCPRMATMNKPCFKAIQTHSPFKPTLIFVSSRRQTRLTALDLIAYLASEGNPKQWLHMEEVEMENVIGGIKESNLKLTLAFGIGLHHAGLHERDRKTVEELYVNQKIQVLIATSTLAWGVNFPAHLVVVKGTEYFDGKTSRYVDFPITDVLQMMGRAGRPQYDDQGCAVILVHDIKKHFYKKFLYEPFPVESSLLEVLADHLNAELVAGTISSKQETMDYITWTYFFRRLLVNPSYYQLESTDHTTLNRFLSSLVEKALKELAESYCLEEQEDLSLVSTVLGRISSYYYLNHLTVRMFREEMKANCTMPQIHDILSNAHEYAELPVRHNEDQINSDLASKLPLPVNPHTMDSSHTKTHLLLQAHFSQTPLPSSDYLTDTKSVMDQAIRILQAMLDVAADQGWLVTALRCIVMVQQIIQGRWAQESSLLMLPHVQMHHIDKFRHGSQCIEGVAELIYAVNGRSQVLNSMLSKEMSATQISEIFDVLGQLPVLQTKLSLKGWWEGSSQEECRPIATRGQQQGRGRGENVWMEVHADQEYVLMVDLNRAGGRGGRTPHKRGGDSKAYCPRFPKPKDEGWFLVLGEVDSQELIALKRVSYVRGSSKQQVSFYTPEVPGRVIYTLYLMSDSYIGMDQQYDLHLDVTPPSIEAQVNAEIID